MPTETYKDFSCRLLLHFSRERRKLDEMYFPVFQKQPLIKSKTKLAKSFKTQNEQKAEGFWKEDVEALF